MRSMTGTAWSAVRPEDLAACRELLRRGSKSLSAAGRLLPARIQPPVTATYAFCRVADDAIDEAPSPTAGLAELRGRLDRLHAGRPDDHPADRAFAATVPDCTGRVELTAFLERLPAKFRP